MNSMMIALMGLLSGDAEAGTLAGVTLPDSVSVSGNNLVLNGMGLREKYWIDIYVGGLYLPAKTSDANKAINDDVPKRITMQFTYGLDKAKLGETMSESIGKSKSSEVAAQAPKLASGMEDVSAGDQIILEYVPGTGTSVIVKGKKKGTIAGVGFMKALWGIYLGPNPPTTALKSGMLGN